MHNRFKKLIKLINEGDANTIQAEADKVKEAIQAEMQRHREELAKLEVEDAWVDTTLTFALPSTPTASNSKPTIYKSPNEKGEDGYTKKQRGNFIREAALALVRKGQSEIPTDDIITELSGRGIVFTIQRPKAAIGSTLSQMKEFERTETGNYRYVGAERQSDALPLIESAEAH